MSPEKITSLAQDSISSGSDSSTGPPLPALDYSLELLRQLRDVVISARDNSKLFAHKAILAKDPLFAALFTTTTTKVSSNSEQSPVLAEYHLDEHPDVLRRRIERAYNGGELRQQEQEEIVVLRAKKKSNHVNGGNRHYQVADTNTDTSRIISAELLRGPLLQSSTSATSADKTFAYEASSLFINTFPFSAAMELDKGLIKRFEGTNSNEGHTCFTYLLLDPVISDQFGTGNSLAVQILTSFFKFSKLTRDNFYRIALEQVNMDLFKRFVSSIFYISHGKGSQMGQLVDVNDKNLKKAAQIKRIIASGRGGPVPLYAFTGISRGEAESRQRLMMQAIGASSGQLVNDASEAQSTDSESILEGKTNTKENQILLGTYLLLKSFLHFVSNGQRQSPVSSSPSSSSSSPSSSVNLKQELLNRIINFK